MCMFYKQTPENNEGAIKNIKKEQSRETGKTGYTRQRKTIHKYNTICVGHHYAPTNY